MACLSHVLFWILIITVNCRSSLSVKQMFSRFLLKNSVLSSEKYFPPLVVQNCETEGFVVVKEGTLQKYDISKRLYVQFICKTITSF